MKVKKIILLNSQYCAKWYQKLIWSVSFLIFITAIFFNLQESVQGEELTQPVVELTSRPISETGSELFSLIGIITHESGVGGYRIYHNQKVLISRDIQPISPVRFNHNIHLQEGLNIIEIIPISHTGALSTDKKVLRITYYRGMRRLWAVIIGIGDYKYPEVPDCKFCYQDARVIADRIHEWVPENLKGVELKLIRLIGRDATWQKIRNNLIEIRRKAGPDDTIVFYFSGLSATAIQGRGVLGVTHYLLPYEANIDPEELPFSAIHLTELGRMLAIRNLNVYILLDTSFAWREGTYEGKIKKYSDGRSVFISQPISNSDRKNIEDKLAANQWLEELSLGGKIEILASSRGTDPASESKEHKHGYFTLFLLDLLDGKGDTNGDGQVSLNEAFAYIYNNVRKETKNEQSPVMMSDATRSPTIAPAKGERHQAPYLEYYQEPSEKQGYIIIRGKVTSDTGLEKLTIEVNNNPVLIRKLQQKTDYKIEESIPLSPYGNYLKITVKDTKGLETFEAEFINNNPTAPFVPVSLDMLFPQNIENDRDMYILPKLSIVRNATYDIQKLLQDFEILYRIKKIEKEKYEGTISFWHEIQIYLEDYIRFEKERENIWNELKNKVVTDSIRLIVPQMKYLDGLWTTEEEIKIQTVVSEDVTDSQYIHKLAVNGALLPREKLHEKSPREKHYYFRVPLKEGTNLIEASVTTSYGLALKKTFHILRQPQRESVALVIGLSEYSKLPNLQFARRNAEDFSINIVKATTIFQDRIISLYDEQATKEVIYDSIRKKMKNTFDSTSGDSIIIYFSGYIYDDEENNLFILPYDTDIKEPSRNGINVEELVERIERALNPTEALLILDALYLPIYSPLSMKDQIDTQMYERPQILADMKDKKDAFPKKRRFKNIVTLPPDWAILLAGTQESWSLVKAGDGKNSLFTKTLLWSINDHNFDGRLNNLDKVRPTMIDLFHLYNRIEEKVREDNIGKQTTELIANLHRPFVFQFLPAEVYTNQAFSIYETEMERTGYAEMDSVLSQKSRRLLEKSLYIDGDESDTLTFLGYIDSLERNFASAEEYFTRAIEYSEKDPEKSLILYIWAESYIGQGNYESAGKLLERAIELEKDPKSKWRIQVAYGYWQALNGTDNNARNYLLKMYQSRDENIDSDAQDLLWMTLGDIAFLEQNLKEAMELYQDVSWSGRNDKAAFFKLAWLAFADGDYDASIRYAKESYPDDTYLKVLTYFSLVMMGKPEEAKELLRDVPRSNPPTWTPKIVSFLLEEIDERQFFALAAADPVKQCEAYFYSALSAFIEGNGNRARDLLDLSIQTEMVHVIEWPTGMAIVKSDQF